MFEVRWRVAFQLTHLFSAWSFLIYYRKSVLHLRKRMFHVSLRFYIYISSINIYLIYIYKILWVPNESGGSQINPGVPNNQGFPNKSWGPQIVLWVPNMSQGPKSFWGSQIVKRVPKSCSLQRIDSLSLFPKEA